jgi:hypothetical protein
MEFTGSPLVMLWAGRGMAIAIGAAAGYGFYKFVGCRTGGCPITSNPWLSTLYGAFLGGMMFWH